MTEYVVSDKLLESIKKTSYNAGRTNKPVYTCRAASEEIVRCRDCRYAAPREMSLFLNCVEMGTIVESYGYCYRGERKEDVEL